MPGGSFDGAPSHGKSAHQDVDAIYRLMLRLIGEMGVANRGQNGLMAEDFLNLDQIYAGFNQMRGIAMAQTVRRDLFFTLQASATLPSVICTPPRSSGVLALRAPFKPP